MTGTRLWYVPDELRQAVKEALESGSSVAERGALVLVAYHFGISYNEPDDDDDEE